TALPANGGRTYRPPTLCRARRRADYKSALLLLLLISCAKPEVAIPPTRPDIILITIDTLRADSVGFAGNTRVKTPFLDRLASQRIVFTNALAHNVVTLPSHVSISTGLY